MIPCHTEGRTCRRRGSRRRGRGAWRSQPTRSMHRFLSLKRRAAEQPLLHIPIRRQHRGGRCRGRARLGRRCGRRRPEYSAPTGMPSLLQRVPTRCQLPSSHRRVCWYRWLVPRKGWCSWPSRFARPPKAGCDSMLTGGAKQCLENRWRVGGDCAGAPHVLKGADVASSCDAGSVRSNGSLPARTLGCLLRP